jgi:hypothetical protein
MTRAPMLASRLRSLRPVSFLVGAGLVAYAGCSSSASTADSVTHPTMIAVSPEAFLGDLPCATSGAELKRYVATLFDTNDTGEGGATAEDQDTQEHRQGEPGTDQFQLPSSMPTPCSAAVGFGYVVAGRHYQVRVDGYDTDDIAPRALGARQMVRKSDGETLLAPRWHAECYRAIPVESTIVQADRCGELSSDGTLRVDLKAALSQLGLSCSSASVSGVQVSVPGVEKPFDFPPPDCLQPFERGFPAGPATVTVSATTAEGDVQTLTCHGDIEPGKLTLAECDLRAQ